MKIKVINKRFTVNRKVAVVCNRQINRFLPRVLCASFLASCALSGVTPLAYAGSADVGKLVSIEQEESGLVMVFSSGERALVPGCVQREPRWWALDPNTVAGQEQLRELVALRKAKKKVRIVGTGECSQDSGVETISFFYPVSPNPTSPKRQ